MCQSHFICFQCREDVFHQPAFQKQSLATVVGGEYAFHILTGDKADDLQTAGSTDTLIQRHIFGILRQNTVGIAESENLQMSRMTK